MKTFRFTAALILICIAGTALAGNGYGNRYGDYRRHEIRERRMDWRGYERPCAACVHPGYYSAAPVLYPAPVIVYGAYGRGRCHHRERCHDRHDCYRGRRR